MTSQGQQPKERFAAKNRIQGKNLHEKFSFVWNFHVKDSTFVSRSQESICHMSILLLLLCPCRWNTSKDVCFVTKPRFSVLLKTQGVSGSFCHSRNLCRPKSDQTLHVHLQSTFQPRAALRDDRHATKECFRDFKVCDAHARNLE